MVLPHIFFKIVVQVFHTRECYNKTQVLKRTGISGTSQQMHVHQSTHMCFIFSNIRVLLLWISHVFVATQVILISLGWTTYYHHWEVLSSTLQEVTKRSHGMQKHLKFTVLYSWNPFYINEDVITLITKFFFTTLHIFLHITHVHGGSSWIHVLTSLCN